MKKIVWALFDDGVGSWNHLQGYYDEEYFTIISIGINNNKDWKNYYSIDLSLSNDKLIKQLSKLPKPDIIVASPPCESWSIADNQQRIYRDIQSANMFTGTDSNMLYFYTKQKILDNNKKLPINMNRDWYRGFKTMLIGISTTTALGQIIEHFKPIVYVIENPMTSKIWDWLYVVCNLTGVHNNANYNNYDNTFSKKPTTFLSNINLGLDNSNNKAQVDFQNISGYDKRSAIPKILLEDILYKIKNHLSQI